MWVFRQRVIVRRTVILTRQSNDFRLPIAVVRTHILPVFLGRDALYAQHYQIRRRHVFTATAENNVKSH